MSDTSIITQFLNQFDTFIQNGFGLVSGDVQFLISFVIVLSLTLAGLYWALSDNGDVLAPFLRKVLVIGFFAFLVNQWPTLIQTIMESFVSLGLKAGGNSISPQQFFDPGKLAHQGIVLYDKINEQANDMSGPIGFFENFGTIIGLSLAAVTCVVAFFVLAIQVFITIIEFKLVTLASFVLLPFGIWNKTSFITERALGYVVSAGLKFMVLALVVSLGYAVFNQLQPGTIPDTNTAFSVALGAVVIVAMSLLAPALASSLISGGPSLGAGAAVTTGAALVGAGAAAAGAASSGARGAAGAGKLGIGATRAAAGAATGGASVAAGAATGAASKLAGGASSAAKSGASGAQQAATRAGLKGAGNQAASKAAGGAAKAASGSTQAAGSSGSKAASATTSGGSAAGQGAASTGAGAGKSSANAASSSGSAGNSRPDKKLPAGSKFQRVQQAASSMQGGDDSGGISATGGTTDED